MTEPNRTDIDERISALVRKADAGIPAGLEARIRTAAVEGERRTRARRVRVLRWSLVPAAAAALILGVFLASPVVRRPAVREIAEIRTEFEIPGKDIKIVFFQKPDFKLFQED